MFFECVCTPLEFFFYSLWPQSNNSNSNCVLVTRWIVIFFSGTFPSKKWIMLIIETLRYFVSLLPALLFKHTFCFLLLISYFLLLTAPYPHQTIPLGKLHILIEIVFLLSSLISLLASHINDYFVGFKKLQDVKFFITANMKTGNSLILLAS